MFSIEDFASVSLETVYVVDFLNEGFHFVPNRGDFLCGYSVTEVMSLGYGFLPTIIHDNDLPLLRDMYQAIRRRLFGKSDLGCIRFFSFTIRIRIKNESKYMMYYHKIRPIFIDGMLRYGLCMMRNSVLDTPGRLRAYLTNGKDYEEYSPKTKKWKRGIEEELTEQEKGVLRLAKRGKMGKVAAGKLCLGYQAYRNIGAAIYKKLKVKSLMQAVIYAFDHQLIFEPNENVRKGKQETQIRPKRTRRLLTPELVQQIQKRLNEGQSIRSIAKSAQVTEGAIRYAIKRGKLTSGA